MKRLKVAEAPGHCPLPSVVPHPDLIDDNIPIALCFQLCSDNLHPIESLIRTQHAEVSAFSVPPPGRQQETPHGCTTMQHTDWPHRQSFLCQGRVKAVDSMSAYKATSWEIVRGLTRAVGRPMKQYRCGPSSPLALKPVLIFLLLCCGCMLAGISGGPPSEL